jgi:hypothetical protein
VTSLINCPQCGAEILPETKFCRRCGALANGTGETDSSELPTQIFRQEAVDPTTHRLEPRTTSPERSLRNPISGSSVQTDASAPVKRRRSSLIAGVIALLILIGIIASVAYVRNSSHSRATADAALIYPGSKTIVDLASGDGRAIQLQTEDPLERVIAWYEASLKPTKTMRLTSTSVVLKNENVTTTLATENGKTNILIKRIR